MGYTEDQIEKIEAEYTKVHHGLQTLMLQTVLAGQESGHAGVREHLLYGAARRLTILKRCLENIFNVFPLTACKPLQKNMVYDVEINLHAYVMSLSGIFDNWAWTFVYRHDLLAEVGGKHGVGLFREDTSKYLPKPLLEYLASKKVTDWHEKYLKSYRDALAHRIPLYIPPTEFTNEEGKRYNDLESKKVELIKAMEWEKLDALYEEQEKIGRPSFMFLHSFKGEPSKPVLLHPQLLCDGLAVVEFGALYMKNWNERS
jgi:hypothetical protein